MLGAPEDGQQISQRTSVAMSAATDGAQASHSFDVSLRLIEREVFGFGLKTSTTKQSWAIIGVICMFAVAALFTSLYPYIAVLAQ